MGRGVKVKSETSGRNRGRNVKKPSCGESSCRSRSASHSRFESPGKLYLRDRTAKETMGK